MCVCVCVRARARVRLCEARAYLAACDRVRVFERAELSKQVTALEGALREPSVVAELDAQLSSDVPLWMRQRLCGQGSGGQ